MTFKMSRRDFKENRNEKSHKTINFVTLNVFLTLFLKN
jgi:hypothetical protein